jgi:glycine cleavage system H protein
VSNVPETLSYTEEHEWITEPSDGVVTIGITAYAAEALGDIVYVSLPQEGASVEAGEPCGEAESTKSVSDIYAPVTGEVVAVNGSAEEDPSVLNTDPYGEGWLFKVRTTGDPAGDLLDSQAYSKLIEEA